MSAKSISLQLSNWSPGRKPASLAIPTSLVNWTNIPGFHSGPLHILKHKRKKELSLFNINDLLLAHPRPNLVRGSTFSVIRTSWQVNSSSFWIAASILSGTMCQVSGSVARLYHKTNVKKYLRIYNLNFKRICQTKDSYSFMGSIPTPETIYQRVMKYYVCVVL